jgi:hypothetical protein
MLHALDMIAKGVTLVKFGMPAGAPSDGIVMRLYPFDIAVHSLA